MRVKKVMIVAVSAPSFSLAKQRLLYANPVDYRTKNVDYLAFYRLKPISAVTHYGKISEIESNVHHSKFFETMPFWMKKDVPIKCYHLEWLKELPIPIKRTQEHNAVIKPVYTSLKILLSAKTLTEIFRQ